MFYAWKIFLTQKLFLCCFFLWFFYRRFQNVLFCWLLKQNQNRLNIKKLCIFINNLINHFLFSLWETESNLNVNLYFFFGYWESIEKFVCNRRARNSRHFAIILIYLYILLLWTFFYLTVIYYSFMKYLILLNVPRTFQRKLFQFLAFFSNSMGS